MTLFFSLIIFFTFSFVQNNQLCEDKLNKNNISYSINQKDNGNKIITFNNQSKRNLEDEEEEVFKPIRIFVETSQIEISMQMQKIFDNIIYLKNSIERATDIISKLFQVKRLKHGVNTVVTEQEYEDFNILEMYVNQSLLNGNNAYDLIIIARDKIIMDSLKEDQHFSPLIMKRLGNGRPILAVIIFDIKYYSKLDAETTQEIYTSILLHEFIHILGFMNSQFNYYKNKNIFTTKVVKRFSNGISKTIVKSEKILKLAKDYFGENIDGLELENQSDFEGIEKSHWEGRILLGDIMTSKFNFQEMVISDFTLALLEESGWYKINYFTGGLMRFGKYKKKQFLTTDCLIKNNNEIKSLFTNEFCSQSFGMCSPGRLSRGYCYTTNYNSEFENDYFRDWVNDLIGEKYVEYCPVSSSSLTNQEKYFIGNCKIGNNSYGSEIKFNDGFFYDYSIFGNKIGEKYGSNSFCALSSVIQRDDDNNKYKGMVRPTCYSMICGKLSLTIEINNEFIVCPREGGMIKIGKGSNYDYTKYEGYIFCPDYNLICTGSEMCNNIFDCVDKKSTYKNPQYDYEINNVRNEITSDIMYNSQLNELEPTEGYELSNDLETKCPANCSHCISNRRCILCRNFTKKEPHAFYIGEIDNEENYINCSEFKPKGGYYNFTRNNHIHFFRCIENCNVCENARICSQCLPEYKINKNINNCIVRIDYCIKYDKSSIYIDTETNNGGQGYKECEQCDNDNNFFCINMDKTNCVNIPNNDLVEYYKMENRAYSCIQKCSDKFENCIQCDINRCKICEKKYKVNNEGHCVERIPNCIKYDESLVIPDPINNGGGLSYKECLQCDISKNYFCIDMNKTICQYIKDYKDDEYFKLESEDNPYSCIRNCSSEFPYCLKCTKDHCSKCIIDIIKNDGTCFPPISNCLKYEKHEEGDNEYLDCEICDQNNSYYCINNNRNNCEFVKNIENYYKIEDFEFSCLNKCEETFPECISCNRSYCFECSEDYVVSNKNKTKCIPSIRRPDDDICNLTIDYDINFDIKELEFEYFIGFYFINLLPYTNFVYHFVNENYTVTMFINSECTEDLLNKGYFKIDSNELYNEMYKMAEIESNELLFSIFITYNHQNHYRFYNIYTQYLNEEKICPNCKDIPFTLTNKYISRINNIFGPSISSLIESEKIDIFSKDSEIFTDACKNLTIEGIDMPLTERYFYLYLNNYSTLIACSGFNCELEEIKVEESISICKCKMGNKFEDILEPIIEFNNFQDENNTSSSSSDFNSFKVLKCAKNGFNKKNILKNAGFFITLISIVLVIACFIVYFICSKTIILPKSGNPPKKIKHRILLFSDWNKYEFNKSSDSNSIIDNDLVQSRDEDDGNIIEEDLTFSHKYDNSSSFSIDTEIGIKRNISNKKNALSEKKSQKILVLLSNKKKGKKRGDKKSDISSQEHEFISTEDSIIKKKNINFCKIYWFVLSIKQHIINFFSNIKCCKITESYIPLPIRFIRSIFMIILSLLLNILFLNQNYFSKKFKYFNEKYKLITIKTEDYIIESNEIINIPLNELWTYAFKHTFINAIIVFLVLLIAQFIIGIIFFSLRNSVAEVIKKNDLNEIKNLITKTKIKYILFFILSLALLILFLFTFIGFGGAYGGASIDYIAPGFIAIIILEIFPFIWSLIIAIFRYIGLKKGHKCFYDFSQFFLF